MKISIVLVKCLLFLIEMYEFTIATMVWELETIPAVFGNDVILKCTLPRNCCKIVQSRRWLGGKDLHLLTMNGFSIDTQKYSEDLNKENETSTLIIHDFDIMDIDVPYECIYGSSTFVKMLNLTENVFEYHKSGPFDGSINITDTNVLSVNISVERVFPRPKCAAEINDEDISSYMTTTVILKGLFYSAIITVTFLLTPASCPGLLSITCEIGTYLLIYEKNVTCNKIISDETQENTGMDAVIVILFITNVIILVAACMCFKITRPKHYHDERISTQECLFTDRFSMEQFDLADLVSKEKSEKE